MTTKLSDKKRIEHEERALRTAQSIAQVDRVMLQEDLASKDLYISNVRPDPQQPRRFYAEDEHELAELAESIQCNGLLQPISVRPDPENADKYVIIVGERRWRASQMAGKTRIRAVIYHMDEYAIRAAQYAENNKRSDVSDVARARSLQAMYEEERRRDGGWAEVARASGITRMHVNRLTSLLRLPDAIVEMIDRRFLASAHGYELVRVVNHMPDEEIVRLAQTCRKAKRGEAFARSVESLREEVNEYLDRVQAARQAKVASSTGIGATLTTGREAAAAKAAGPDAGDSNAGRVPVEGMEGPITSVSEADEAISNDAGKAKPTGSVSLFESAIAAAARPAAPVEHSSPAKAADDKIVDSLRPHVRQVVQEIFSGLLRPEEAAALRQALSR